jgi:hypothetical protein
MSATAPLRRETIFLISREANFAKRTQLLSIQTAVSLAQVRLRGQVIVSA